MTDAPVEWVVVAHKRFPFPSDDVVGYYPTYEDARQALNGLLQNAQWFTSYGIEKRVSDHPR